jgi:subtilase family serine protease
MVARFPARPAALAALLLLLAPALHGPAPAAAQAPEVGEPDLVPLAARPTLANLTEGIATAFVVEVANQGNASAGGANVSFEVAGALLGNATLPPLGPGNRTEVASPTWLPAAGNHTLRVVVDVHGAVAEADEDNNVLELALEVALPPPPRPDLVVLDAGPAAPPELGQPIAFQARILNAGLGPAGPFVVRFTLDDAPLGNATLLALGPGLGASVKVGPWNVTGGNHTLRVEADAEEAVDEAEELNNAFTRRFTAQAPRFLGVDVRVSSILMEPLVPLPGQEVRFSALVENPGPASPAVHVDFVLDNATLGTIALPPMGANASKLVVGPAWNATAGPHELVVRADVGPGNDTLQLNNAMPFRFSVPRPDQRPDLVVEALVVPAQVGIGDKVRLAASVRNAGDWPSPRTQVRFSVDGAVVGNATLEPLAAGATARVEGPWWKATKGAHVLGARIDPQAKVEESQEANNLALRNLTIPHGTAKVEGPRPDLAVEAFTWDPVEVIPGQQVVLRTTIVNQGNKTAGGFIVEFLVDGQVLDRQPVTGVGTIELVVASRPWRATEGRHTLGVRLDAADERTEQEEGNNLAYADLVVAAPPAFLAKELPLPWWAGLAALGTAALAARLKPPRPR